jgi:hypothetical protein
MVDVGLAQAIVKRLNRWYRSRSRPHGILDHTHRGIRMRYNAAYRASGCCASLLLLCIAGALFFGPDLFADKPRWVVWAIKLGWAGITVAALGAPLQAFREFAVVNDEDVMKSDPLGRQTRLEWKEITRLHINLDDNKVLFLTDSKANLKLSLCYNGWQDFVEISAKHLNPMLHLELVFNLAQAGMRKA